MTRARATQKMCERFLTLPELSVLSRQCMNDYFESADQLAERIEAWERKRNEGQTRIDWRFTTTDARIKLRKLYPLI